MQINKVGPGSFQGDAEILINCSTPDEFLAESRRIASRLVDAQTSQVIPGGIVVVFRGITGPEDQLFVGIIKAEVQAGFRRRRRGLSSFTEFVNDLFLTQATRLYKVGFMVAPSPMKVGAEGWRAIVFDHKIVPSNREAAAIYFYEVFLGCGFREDSAYETAKFFNLTQDFAKTKLPDRQERHAVQDALFTYVKNEQAPTFTVNEFAERYLPLHARDKYSNFMASNQFPTRAVKRDVAELRGKLKRRRFKYGTDIELSASPEAMSDGRVTIDTVPPEGADARVPETTIITIREAFVRET